MTMADQDANNNNFALRENLVKTAVEFLQNPKVQSSPVGRKKEFLKRKGLTDEEIQTAFKLALVDVTVDQNVVHESRDYTVVPIPPGRMYPYLQTYPYQITLFQRIKEFFNATALIGATIYCVYWFYKVTVHSYDITIQLPHRTENIDRYLPEFLLLNRKQFPSAPASVPSISIPSWQLDAAGKNQEKSNEREDDAGSGSSTNNSDSSLEMIREDPPKV
ncbi:peroxisomal membrane protein PEX14 [Ceratina calcarata]|uniref:Peroxisomal membrane protein PEX14 n=1 Tax=Ceratina calcarata TaxID=156304 RepID=A0AAJ7W9J6_9HYME|nr:peroxisomal membrane protein PEX14 [Ceratina calcarata]